MFKNIKLDLVPILMVLFCLKALFLQISINETLIVGGLTALFGFKLFFDGHKKFKEYDIVLTKQNEVIAKMATEIDNLKTAVVGVKMGAGFKNKMGA